MRTTTVGLCAIVAGITALVAFTAAAPALEVTYERLLNADKEPHNWLTYYGNYKGWRYSSLSQINTTNVKRLVVKWAFQTGPDQNFQVTPLAVDGVMYLTNEKNHVFALDAATGKLLWRYTHELPDPGKMPFRIWGFGINRGVSLAKGKVLVGTWDAHLLALDAKMGKLLWKVQVGHYEEGQAVLAPPLIVKDMAILGIQAIEMAESGVHQRLQRGHGGVAMAVLHDPRTGGAWERDVGRRFLAVRLWLRLAAGDLRP